MATSKTEIARLMDNNTAFTKDYPTPPTMKQIRSRLLSKPEASGTLILTCLDPRVVPEKFFGPDMSNAVIRNAGGRVSEDVIRSITVLRSLGNLRSVLVIHHTDCGMTHLTNDEVVKKARARTPAAAQEIEGLGRDYGCYTAEDYEKSIEEDVIRLRNAKILEGMSILGMALDTPSGKVEILDV